MIEEDLLRSLGAGTELESERPLHEIHRRGRQFRRRRQVLTAGGTTLAAVAALAVAAPFVLDDGRPDGTVQIDPANEPTVAPAVSSALPAWDAPSISCDQSKVDELTTLDAGAVLYLPPASLAGPLSAPPQLERITYLCTPATDQLVWYAMDGDEVGPSLSVAGPDGGDPWSSLQSTGWLRPMTPIRVGDDDGQYGFEASTGVGHVEWLADGKLWIADSTGMTEPALLAAVRSIVIQDGHVDFTRLPTGLTDLVPSLGGEAGGAATGIQSTAHYEDPVTHEETGQWTVTLANDRRIGGGTGWRPLTINGQDAWLSQDGLTAYVRLGDGIYGQWIDESGLRDADDVIAIIKAVTEVPYDDPRYGDQPTFTPTTSPTPTG